MHKFFRISTLAVLALSATALTAQAQEKATELTAGVMGLQYTTCSGCDGLFEAVTGGAYFSGAFYLSPGMALEPILSSSISTQGGVSLSRIGLGLGLPYYFNKGWGRKGAYLEPRIQWTSISATLCDGCDSQSASQFGLGIALGTKVPLNDAAALRVQGSFDYGFENSDFVATTAFGASLGLSVFLK